MKSFEVMSLSQTAEKCEDGVYNVSQLEHYEAFDTATGAPVDAYIALCDGVWRKVPPVGCRTIAVCSDDIFAQLKETGHITMTVRLTKGRKRDYKMVTFSA